VPTVEENLSAWNEQYDWAEEGDEWSSGWGGADAQWFGALFPRLRHYLPASVIVEIAPGHGRWTNYLAQHCDRLISVDLSSACIDEISTKLAPGGVAFLHHSNAGEHLDLFAGWDELPVEDVQQLEQSGLRPPRHWRAMSMTAAKMRQFADDAGLVCIGQEIVNWGGDVLIDCFSVLALPGPGAATDTAVVRNKNFTAEMRSIRATTVVYGDAPV